LAAFDRKRSDIPLNIDLPWYAAGSRHSIGGFTGLLRVRGYETIRA
jgi:hypothetical protein